MDAIWLIAEAVPDAGVPPLPEAPRPGVCCVTGRETETIDRLHLLTSSFTQWDLLRRPESGRIAVAVWRAWMYGERREGKKRDYRPERMACWRVTRSRFEVLDRDGVRTALLEDPPAEPWAGYITTSYKKHGSLLAPVNRPGSALWLFEDVVVDCSDREKLYDWWEKLRRWQDLGIYRSMLEAGDLEPHVIRKIGIEEALTFLEWARPRRSSPLYQLLVTLLPPKKGQT